MKISRLKRRFKNSRNKIEYSPMNWDLCKVKTIKLYYAFQEFIELFMGWDNFSALFVFWLIMAVLDKLIHEQKTFVTVDPYISRLSCQSSFCSEKGWSSLVEFSILELQRLWNTNSNVCSPEEEAAWAIKQEQGQSSLHRVPVLTDMTLHGKSWNICLFQAIGLQKKAMTKI